MERRAPLLATRLADINTVYSTRNMALFSMAALGSGYFTIKSKTLAEKQKVRPAGDYAVTVDRSGMFLHNLPAVELGPWTLELQHRIAYLARRSYPPRGEPCVLTKSIGGGI